MTTHHADSTTNQKRYLERVRALLAKAESTSYEEEAAALTAKAHQLMVAHAISAAMVQESTGRGDICTVRLTISSPYVKQKYLLLSAVAKPNNCRAILGIERSYLRELLDSGRFSQLEEGSRLATVVGYRSDLDVVETLFTSLLLQAVNLMLAHGSIVTSWGNETRAFRNAFLLSFGRTVRERLEANIQAATSEARMSSSGEVLPVLAARADRVKMATDEKFPHTTSLQTSVTNGEGFAAGRNAGRRADIGNTRFRPATRGLSSGQ